MNSLRCSLNAPTYFRLLTGIGAEAVLFVGAEFNGTVETEETAGVEAIEGAESTEGKIPFLLDLGKSRRKLVS